MAVALSDLITRSKRRADREGSAFVSDAEWTDYINEVVSELHDILVASFEDYLLTSATVTLVSGTHSYALPTDFYKERGVEFVSGSETYTLRPFVFRERNRYQFASGFMLDSRMSARYQILGNYIRFVPTPSSAGTVTLWYVPQPVKLVATTDALNVAIVSGWDSFVVAGAAAKALIKEESDAGPLLAEKGQIGQRIQVAAKGRASGEPQRIVDVTTPETDWLWR